MHIWWQFTHQLVFGHRKKKRAGRGMWQVHTFHFSRKNTKHYNPTIDVRESHCLYRNKNRLSHNCPHQNTYTHIHTAADRVLLFLTSVSQGQSEYSSNCATCICQKPSIFSQLFISFSLLTSFSLMLGQMWMSLLRFGKAKCYVISLDQQGSCASFYHIQELVISLTPVMIPRI